MIEWLKQLEDRVGRRLALKPTRFVKTAGWVQAPDELLKLHDSQSAPRILGKNACTIKWRRRTHHGVSGLLKLPGGRLYPRSVAGFKLYDGDAHARRVEITTSTGRPVYAAFYRAPLLTKFREGVKTLSRGSQGSNNRHPRLKGKSILLGAMFADSGNYFHFWMDIIGDLWFANQLGLGPESIDHYILPFSGARWQCEILDLCGVPLEQVISISSFDSLRADELFLPVRAKGGRLNPSWLVRGLREACGYTARRSVGGNARKIYVSRRDALRRPLAAESEISAFLQSHGYEEVSCAGLTVREQQQLFGEADAIIAPHGAALTNLIWCRPGTRIVEFLPVEHANPCFFDLSGMSELDYACIPAGLVDKEDNRWTGAVRIEIDDLQKLFVPSVCGIDHDEKRRHDLHEQYPIV